MLQLMDKKILTFLRSEFFFRSKKKEEKRSLVSGNVSIFLRHRHVGKFILDLFFYRKGMEIIDNVLNIENKLSDVPKKFKVGPQVGS